MGEIINKTFERYRTWHAPVEWIRANIGYLGSEVADLERDSVADTAVVRELIVALPQGA